jgi:hypothetical protein
MIVLAGGLRGKARFEEAYGRTLPTLVNFSDGAVYHASFHGQGVDYFELLDAYEQNAIWGEDWATSWTCPAMGPARPPASWCVPAWMQRPLPA